MTMNIRKSQHESYLNHNNASTINNTLQKKQNIKTLDIDEHGAKPNFTVPIGNLATAFLAYAEISIGCVLEAAA